MSSIAEQIEQAQREMERWPQWLQDAAEEFSAYLREQAAIERCRPLPSGSSNHE